jgi:hypothetical protein
MAKYRVVALPKAQKGLSKKRKESTAPRQSSEAIYPMNQAQYQDMVNPFGTAEEQAYLAQSQAGDAAYQDMLNRMDASREGRYNEFSDMFSKLSTQNVIQDLQYRKERFDKSKKYDKIEPFKEVPLDGYSPEMKQNMLDMGFLPYENKKKGVVELYPKEEIATRIINNGLRTDEIVKKLGIADEKTIKSEFGELMKAADEQYGATITSKVLDEAIKKGISPEEAMEKLPKSYGTTEGLKNKYLKQTNKVLEEALKNVSDQMGQGTAQEQYGWLFNNSSDPESDFNRAYYTKADGSPDWDKINARSERVKEAKKEAKTFNKPFEIKRNTFDTQVSDQFSNYQNYYDQELNTKNKQSRNQAIERGAASEPFQEALSKYIAPDAMSVYSEKLTKKADEVLNKKNYSDIASMLHNLSPSGRVDDIFTAEERDQNKESIGNIVDRKFSQPTFESRGYRAPVSTLDKIQDMVTYAPFFMQPGDQSYIWDNERTLRDQREIEKQTGQDIYGDIEGSGGLEMLNTWNPLRLGYESRKNVEAGRFKDLALDVASSVLPEAKAFGRGLTKAGRKLISNKPLNAALTGYGYVNALRPDGSIDQAVDAFNDNRAGEGIENAGWAALELMPAIGPASRALRGLKTLNTPGGKIFKSFNSPYSAGYLTPKGSAIGVGNINTANASPVFTGITNPINKFITPRGLGNISILKQNPGRTMLNYQVGGYADDAARLIRELQEAKLLSKSVNVDLLKQYPNLLNLATKRGIQDANTVFRSTRPLLGSSNIAKSSMGNQSELPAYYVAKLKSLPSDEARAAYMSSHVPPVRVGHRTGLRGLDWDKDALYFSKQQDIKNPKLQYTYGPLQTELRIPFDFSEGDAATWLEKYRSMPFKSKEWAKNDAMDLGNKAKIGDIYDWYFKKQKALDMGLDSSWNYSDEGAVVGNFDQRALEPVRVRYNQTVQDLEAEQALNDYITEIHYDESPEQQQAFIDMFNKDLLPGFDFSNPQGMEKYEIPLFLKKNPKGIAETLYDVQDAFYKNNRIKTLRSYRNPDDVKIVPYSPFTFGFEKGGTIELELDQKDIDKYIKKGYMVEEVD